MWQWQVTAEVVVVPAPTPFGVQVMHVHRGALLPPGVPEDRISHLLSVRMIRPFSGDPASVPTPLPAGVTTNAAPAAPVDADSGVDVEPVGDNVPYDDPDRQAARAKLPADGSLPDGRSGQAVWVEYLVARGYDYNALAGQDKTELVDLARKIN